jgi:hypothetical protein
VLAPPIGEPWLGDDDSVETIKHRRGLNNNHKKKEEV